MPASASRQMHCCFLQSLIDSFGGCGSQQIFARDHSGEFVLAAECDRRMTPSIEYSIRSRMGDPVVSQ
jgi:hypothetical protein